jgi:predicted O-linked N-acetylglucosamine transferase (SPINDLY family)
MEEFFNLYNKIKENPKYINIFGNIVINKGVEIYNNKNIDLSVKEIVLSKLIEIFPNEPAFYYYMGYCFKDVDPIKAVTFFEKSYQINPYNVENLIDYCNALFATGNTKKVIEMDKNIPFGDNLKDVRLLNVFINCKYKEHHHKGLLEQLLYIIKVKANDIPVTQIDKDFLHSTYMNAGQMFSNLGDCENSILYTEKAFELANKYNLTPNTKFASFQNYVMLENYEYHDVIKYYDKTLIINSIYPNINKYNFDSRTKHSKIRIGYVSSDFVDHAVSNFILPILKNHDTELFEIYIFYNKQNGWNALSNLKLNCYSIFELSDEEAADLINICEIDILFELNGYTNNSRLGIFSLNPAPIQITYLGYPNTTGMQGIKYRITDNISDHEKTLQKFSEKLIKMPKCFLLFDSINQTMPIIPRKTKETIILGSLNNEKKNSKEVLNTWKTIMEICPNTKLLIKLVAYDDVIEKQKFYMHKLNVTKDRLILLTKLDDDGYNKLFSMVDIVLDTFPYSGTTTTCNSLYNSIPVVTLYNKDYHSHNVSSSILKNAGLDELVTYNKSEYISLVKKLTENPLQIEEYKKTIRQKFTDSMNVNAFMYSFENILKELYQKHNTSAV